MGVAFDSYRVLAGRPFPAMVQAYPGLPLLDCGLLHISHVVRDQ